MASQCLRRRDGDARWVFGGPASARRICRPAVIVLLAGLAQFAAAQTAVPPDGLTPSLRAASVVSLVDRLGAAEPVSDSLQVTRGLAFADFPGDQAEVVAYEENKLFVCAVAWAGANGGESPPGGSRGPSPRWIRRIVLLKPATLVVDDSLRAASAEAPVQWLLYSKAEPEVAGRRVRVVESGREIVCETLLPEKLSPTTSGQEGEGKEAGHVVTVSAEFGSPEVRFLHVLQVGPRDGQAPAARSELVQEEGRVRLTISTPDRVFRLTLPPARLDAGEIEIADAHGQPIMERRVLPSGVLPHGPEGIRLLERWDSAYRGDRRAGWDTGRPSSNLKQAIEQAAVRPCRAVELGCGTGTNAIWLAQQGFDVTAIDVAPTALSLARKKAEAAGVSVRWLLADVLAPPPLEPFDFVFDRGCYHGVRRVNAAGYVQSVRRLTRPGARVLILAGNANDPNKGGPPRVTESEIRGDFSDAFEFEWLRETRFDTSAADQAGPMAWSILLRRKAAVRVLVDPRVELLSVIFRLAGNPEYAKGRVPSYTDDVEAQFGPFRDHPAVTLARELRRTRGVSYDAVMSMAVHVADAYALEEKVPFEPRPEGLDARWPTDRAREFLDSARQFVKDTSFKEFIEKHQPLYELTESRMRDVLQTHAHLEWFDEFFGERPRASFTVALGLLNGPNCYGPHVRLPDGSEELYCILGVWATDGDGQPRFTPSVLETVTHEFCHSYTNAIVDRHEAELESAGKRIYARVEKAMSRQAYGNWKTMIYESMVRACVIRYTRKYRGLTVAWLAVRQEKSRGFQWMGGLSDLLGEYEENRDKYPTLDAFFPRVVTFFNEYAESFAAEQEAMDKKRPKLVSVTPANGATDVDPNLAQIKAVFDRPMQDGSWSLVGGGPNFPETAGKPAYDETKTVWSVPVKLKPDWDYRFMLNSDRFQSFRSQEGVPLAPVEVRFRTRKL